MYFDRTPSTSVEGFAGYHVSGRQAGPIGPAEDVGDCILVDAQRFNFEPIEEATVVKAGPCLSAIRETGLERRGLVGPYDAKIAKREVQCEQLLIRATAMVENFIVRHEDRFRSSALIRSTPACRIDENLTHRPGGNRLEVLRRLATRQW